MEINLINADAIFVVAMSSGVSDCINFSYY